MGVGRRVIVLLLGDPVTCKVFLELRVTIGCTQRGCLAADRPDDGDEVKAQISSKEQTNVPFTMLGAGLLWVGWLGYVLLG